MGLLDAVGGISGGLSGLGSLASSAGDIAALFKDPENPFKGHPNQPFRGVIGTNSYTLGAGQLTRKSDFLSEQRRLRSLLGTLRPTTLPGQGLLTSSGVNALRQRAAQQAGNLRSQAARKNLLGASFVDDSIARVEREFADAEMSFRAQAFETEMQQQLQIIDREAASLSQTAELEIAELGLAANFLSQVNQISVGQKQADQFLAQQAIMQKLSGAGQEPAPATPAPAAPAGGGTTPPRVVSRPFPRSTPSTFGSGLSPHRRGPSFG